MNHSPDAPVGCPLEAMKSAIALTSSLLLGIVVLPVLLAGGDPPPMTICGQHAGSTDTVLATIRTLESGGNYRAQAAGSTASGAYQFLDNSWAGYGGYTHAKDAPPEVQDAKAAENVTRILNDHGGDVTTVPVVWCIGNVPGPTSAEWDTVPYPGAGNRLAPRLSRVGLAHPMATPIYAVRGGRVAVVRTWPYNWWNRGCGSEGSNGCLAWNAQPGERRLTRHSTTRSHAERRSGGPDHSCSNRAEVEALGTISMSKSDSREQSSSNAARTPPRLPACASSRLRQLYSGSFSGSALRPRPMALRAADRSPCSSALGASSASRTHTLSIA